MTVPVALREALLDEIANLIGKRGAEAWLASPILEPSARFFPDRWKPDLGGVERLARRLLAYADLDLRVDVLAAEDVEPSKNCRFAEHAPVWYEGLVENRLQITVDLRNVEDDEGVAASLCHAIAHAYREFHGLGDRDPSSYRSTRAATGIHDDEGLVDATTVYLGFGVLTANASERHRARGRNVGTLASRTVSVTKLGVLGPEAMSFALAAQIVSRELADKDRKRLFDCLDANQASACKRACAEFDAGEIAQILDLPARDRRPAPRDLAALTQPLPDDELDVPAPKRRRNESARVFRVASHPGITYSILGAAAGAIGGLVLASGAATPAVIGACGLAVVSFCAGWLRKFDVCSDPMCEAKIPPDADRCPRCGGRVSGRIKTAADRLEAEEKLEDAELEREEER